MSTETAEQVSTTAPVAPKVDAIGPFTAEQLAAAKLAYDGLHALFARPNVSVNVGTQGSPEANGDHKTMGDVGDKALDLLQQGASKTLDLLGQGAAQIAATTEKAAPVVWRIMVKQQIANALANIIGPLVMLLGAYIFHLIIVMAYGNPTDPDLIQWKVGLGLVAPIAAAVAGTIWLVVSLMDSLQQLVNPQYFAARDLIEMITGRRRSN